MSFIFLLWICLGAVFDAIYRKCYNWYVISGFGLALVSAILIPETHPVQISIADSVFGFFGALLVLIIFYALKMMSAGDVKFAAVLGLWIGWEQLLIVWALSCAFAVVHGLYAKSNFKYFFWKWIPINSEVEVKGRKFIPYVTYLSLATIIVLVLRK